MFAGLISKEQSVSAWGDASKIMAALAPYSLDKPRDVWTSDRQMLVQVATRTGSTSADIYRHSETGVAVAFWGRLDNRPDLVAQLDAEHKASDDELIALAWLKWGECCPERLIGDFAFALASPKTGVVFLARDVMGVKPLYYQADEHGVFFANSAAAFKPLLLGTLTRSQKWMAEYMLGLSYSHTETAYEEIKKLSGAHCLLIHADGRMNIRRYHQFVDDAPLDKKRDPKYLEAYRDAWQEAVACRRPASGNIGAENSGGLDSGSITAEIARQLGADIDRLYAFGCCHSSREPEFIMATAMRWKIKNNILFSHDIDNHELAISERMLYVNGYPLEYDENSFTYPTYQFCATHSIGTLYSGHGGDQVVTQSNVQAIRYELIDQKAWLILWQILPGNSFAKVARFLKNVHQAGKTNASYRQAWVEARKAKWRHQFLNDDIVLKFNLEARNSAAASYDEGMRRIGKLAIKLLNTPYVSTRLENCSLEAASFGIDYVWPMLDQRLIQQWLSTPAVWKVKDGGLSRHLHRCAIANVSSEMVAWWPSKDMGGYSYTKNCCDKDYKHILTSLLKKLVEKESELLKVIDKEKAKKIADHRIDVTCDSIVASNINNLTMLDYWCSN